jgi:hypothetical protein
MERGMRASGFQILVATTALASLVPPATSLARDVAGAPAQAASPPEAGASDTAERPTAVPAFLRDTALALRLRSHYVDVETVSGVEREAWALGGWIAYRSGWLADALQLGATLFGSAPAYAPEDKADTLLLAPGKEGFQVLGEAFAAARYRAYVAVKAYRQEVQQPFINRQDNAMVPNTFEGVTAAGALGPVDYVAGYLTRMKTRNADRFVPMSEAAGAAGSDDGVALLGIELRPLPGLTVQLAEQYGVDTFNTLFLQVERVRPVGHDASLALGAQLTDQRAVGDALVAVGGEREWRTWNGSARLALTYREVTLRAGVSVTGPGNKVQSPWGFYPGYLRMDQQQFNNADEKAWVVGLVWEPRGILRGLTAFANLAWGVESSNPATGASMADEAEYDLVVAYRPPAVAGLLLRGRALRYEQAGADRVGSTLRFTVNWEIPVLRPAQGQSPRGGGPRAELRAGRPTRRTRSSRRGSERSGSRSGSTFSQAIRPIRSS